ncbi:MAG: DUF4340 domain-containing protein [Gammaproteobacteria bacterium]|nr:DUF4340 domain-containing protein [Gammaproteobacteria bacterium]
MKLRSLITLVIAIAVIAAAGIITQRKAPTTELEQQALYPDLLAQVNVVHTLEVKSKDGAVTIARDGDQWVVRNFDNYPGLIANVKRGLVQLASLKIVEAKTSKPEKYATLSVEDVTLPNAGSRLVTGLSAEGKPLVELLIGKQRSAKSLGAPSFYVRRVGENAAYLVAGELEFTTTITDWLDTTVANLPVDRVRQVTLHPATGSSFTVSKANSQEQLYVLDNVPDGQEVRARATVSSIGGLLLDAKFEKVIAASKLAGLKPRARAELETFDGLTGTVEAFDYLGEVFVVLKFAHRPETAGSKVSTPSEKEIKLGNKGPKPTPPKTPEEVAKEVSELNTRLSNWAYVLPDYKARLLDKTLPDLLKKKGEPEKMPVISTE